MRLNPDKCVFGAKGGKFLGFILPHRGIHTNPNKCQAIMEMRSPRNMKETQMLAGRISTLFRFLPRIVERAKQIINLLKKTTNFKWNNECEETFWQSKVTLATPPVLSKPSTDKKLIVYLPISAEAISAVLVKEENSELRLYTSSVECYRIQKLDIR